MSPTGFAEARARLALADLERGYRDALARLREKRGLTTAQHQAEHAQINARFARDRERVIQAHSPQKERAGDDRPALPLSSLAD